MSQVCQSSRQAAACGEQRQPRAKQDAAAFAPNLHYHRFWVENKKRFVRLRISAKGLRIVDKKGIEAVLAKQGLGARGLASPRIPAKATFALNSAEYCFLFAMSIASRG